MDYYVNVIISNVVPMEQQRFADSHCAMRYCQYIDAVDPNAEYELWRIDADGLWEQV